MNARENDNNNNNNKKISDREEQNEMNKQSFSKHHDIHDIDLQSGSTSPSKTIQCRRSDSPF